MKTVEEIRRIQLSALKARFGTMAALNDRLGRAKTDSTLTQYLNSSKGSKTQKPKQMGSPMARAIEAALDLETGWMDNDPGLVEAAKHADRTWPFALIDETRVVSLDGTKRAQLEGMIVAFAGQIGIGIVATPSGAEESETRSIQPNRKAA